MNIYEKFKEGGKWLGTARKWMQSNIRGGDRLKWSSTESVSIPFNKLEDFAFQVAVSAGGEIQKMYDKRKNMRPVRFYRLGAERKIDGWNGYFHMWFSNADNEPTAIVELEDGKVVTVHAHDVHFADVELNIVR